MDQAFLPLKRIIEQMMAFGGELVDDEAGVRSRIYECSVDSPLELDVCRDEANALRLGATPPLYYVDTTFRPSFHRVRFTVELARESSDE